MFSKKQRKSSRFYNDKLRKSYGQAHEANRVSLIKQRGLELRRQARELQAAPVLSIAPISIMRRREERTARLRLFSFIPKSARAVLSLFKKVS